MKSDIADPQQSDDRRSLRRAMFAALALHGVILCLLLLPFGAPRLEAPVISRIKLVVEHQSHGAAGAAGSGNGDIAAQGEQGSAAVALQTPASAEMAPPEPMAAASLAEVLPPMPPPALTGKAPLPPEPQHKPKPLRKTTIGQPIPPSLPLTEPIPAPVTLPVPASPPPIAQAPATAAPGANDYAHLPDEVSHWASNTRSDSGRSSADGSGTGGPPSAEAAGGHGTAAAGNGSAALGRGDPNDPDDDYLDRLRRYVEPYKKYPAPAIEQKQEGFVIVGFTIDRSGTILRTWVVQSSGSEVLDRAALKMFRDASPVPPPPDRDITDQRDVKMQINYKLGAFDRLFR